MSNITSTDSMEPKKKYFVNYNQDSTSIAVGNKNGYRLYALNNVDDIEEIYRNDKEDTFIVERLFNSSLVAIVSLTALRTLKVCHYKKGTDICNYSYPNSILAVRMNRVRLIVCLEDSLIIHNIRDMKLLHTIKDTPPNPQGLCALSTSSDNCLLAYPGSTSNGEVQIFDAVELHAKTMIYAHDSPLGALAFNCKGTMLATASQKGTVIRVFKTHTGEKLFELRRGLKRCVDICSMAFSSGGLYLAVCSNTETVHVFRLMEEHAKDISSNSPLNTDDNIGGGGGTSSASASSLPSAGLLGNYWSTLQSMLPTQVTDVFNQGRAFATAYLPVSNVRSVVAIAPMQNQLRVLVATDEGILYVYNITNEGGDMPLYRQHRLDDPVVVSKSPSNRATSDETSKTTEPGSALLGSYAGIVKGNPTGEMSGTESDKLREIAAATEQPTEGAQRYDQDYPPLGQNTD